MLRLLMLGLQVIVGDERPQALPSFTTSPPCPSNASSDDIVVCGKHDPDHDRLRSPASGFDQGGALPRAELGVGNARVSATTQQGMVGTIPTNRVMLNVKIPF